MYPLHEQERENFQRDLDALPDDNTLTLIPKEYPGPVKIDHPCVIDGRGCTIWALNGPIVTCDADGVTLRNLRVEITGDENGPVEDHCALKVSPGCRLTLENVEVRGSVSGLWQEEGDWQYPFSLHIGTVPFSSELDLLLRMWVPVPCEIASKISGLLVQPQKLEPGANEVTLHIERIAKDTLLNGVLSITTPNVKRSIAVSGYISSSRQKKPRAKKALPVAWQPDEWEKLVALPRPAHPTPPPYVAPPPRRSRPAPAPTFVPAPVLPAPPVPVPAPPPPPVSLPTVVPPLHPISLPTVVPPPPPVPPHVPVPLPVPLAVTGPKPFYRKPIVVGASAIFVLALGLAYWLFSGSKFDPNKIKELHKLGVDSEALAVAFSPDGKTLASGSKSGAVKLWTVSTGNPTPEQLRQGYEGAINSVAFSHNGNLLASGGDSRKVVLWDMNQVGVIKGETVLDGEVSSVVFSLDDATLICGSHDGTLRFLDTQNLQKQIKLNTGSPIKAVALSRDGKLVATGDESGTVKIWETGTKGMKQQLSPKHGGPVLVVAFANTDPNILATGGSDGQLVLWDLQKGEVKSPSPFRPGNLVTAVAFSLDDQTIVSGGGGRDTVIRIWSTTDGSTLKSVLVNHSGAINAIAFSSRGVIASGSSDKTVRLWATP